VLAISTTQMTFESGRSYNLINRSPLSLFSQFPKPTKVYTRVEPEANGGGGARQVMRVSPSTSPIRPYVVCAVLRGVAFTPPVYKSFIDLQEHLHRNICRRRTLVAIGTHDLDTLQGPFRYSADAPGDISFSPLTAEDGRVFWGKELLDFYRTDETVKHLKAYTDIIYDSPAYPIIRDSRGVVLSLPPIINGRHSRITPETKNVFIECTATDKTKANIVLDTMVRACVRGYERVVGRGRAWLLLL
jgi:phenylalanyl-tRNA synthetase beta chain